MKVRIGSIEIECETIEEIDALIARYGPPIGGPDSDPPKAAPGAVPPLLGTAGSPPPPPGTDPAVAMALQVPKKRYNSKGEEVVTIGGREMTASEIKAMRERIAAPTALPKPGPE